MEQLKSSRRPFIVLIVLVAVSVYSGLYAAGAYKVASHITESPPQFYWSSAPAGSFFPWPREPGMLEALSEISQLDLFIYLYLVRTWVLAAATFLLWVLVFLQAANMVRQTGNPYSA